MSNSQYPQQKLIFITTVINKMSRLFSQLNDVYLRAMLPNESQQKETSQNVSVKRKCISKRQSAQLNEASGEDTIKNILCETDKTLQKNDRGFKNFFKDHRAEISKQFSHCKSDELKNLAFQIWNDLEVEQKAYYEAKSKEGKRKRQSSDPSPSVKYKACKKEKAMLKRQEKAIKQQQRDQNMQMFNEENGTNEQNM